MNEAHSAVRRAVKRDYSKPLDVAPVCHSCNHKRGPAKPHPGIQEAQRKARAYYAEVLV